jgi:exopolyphosphatase/guanosine-5'-triphosphate,3'-diphosphate pyrophosphatase
LRGGGARPGARARPCFAALDLGTNNCRLLIAEPAGAGFRVVDGYSEIVRLGEGLAASGRLSEAAMRRTYGALQACAERIAYWRPAALGCIATQACRAAENGPDFLARVSRDLGLDFQVISPEEEARLAVLGCVGLLDPSAEAALIVDIGGGSTELSFVSPQAVLAGASASLDPPILHWGSSPVGVVTLADADPEPAAADVEAWYAAMVARIAEALEHVGGAEALKPLFESGRAHIIGTSGAVTSLAGVHLGLTRYQRSRVDGIWMSVEDCRRAIASLRQVSPRERAANPCIGKQRADLVVPGGAILDAVCRLWPAERIRAADRGLREGILLRLIAQHASNEFGGASA